MNWWLAVSIWLSGVIVLWDGVEDHLRAQARLWRRVRGHLWMIRRFGLRAWWSYERARRAGVTIDYTLIFTPEELDDIIQSIRKKR